LYYTLHFARNFVPDEDICLTSDDPSIIRLAQEYDYKAPFVRPKALAQDNSPMQDVLLHALSFYEGEGKEYDAVMLLQPTSPFRSKSFVESIIGLYSQENGIDMIASVGAAKLNPYFNLFEELGKGWLGRLKKESYESRQECPPVYYFNGSMYLINVRAVQSQRMNRFEKVRKFLMDDLYSIDIDTELDWLLCEALLEKKKVQLDFMDPVMHL
jgi:CMP-N,N'-diacetyllegionaminic acid synthase